MGKIDLKSKWMLSIAMVNGVSSVLLHTHTHYEIKWEVISTANVCPRVCVIAALTFTICLRFQRMRK